MDCFADLNLIDWSQNNHLAVALGDTVYLWNAATGEIVQLVQYSEPDVYVSSVRWIKEGNVLGVGNSSGMVEVGGTRNVCVALVCPAKRWFHGSPAN